jgi:tRNA(Arg) A34 adenosine deaminase TadA
LINHPQLNHQMDVRGGVLAGRSAEILQEFFRKRR